LGGVGRRPTLFWKIARIRAARGANLVDRLARLLTVLANPARYVARFLKELHRGLRLGRLVPQAPPAVALICTVACVVAFEDTS
jgi:hypothetical protein